MTNGSWMKFESIVECSTNFWSFWEWPFYTGFTVHWIGYVFETISHPSYKEGVILLTGLITITLFTSVYFNMCMGERLILKMTTIMMMISTNTNTQLPPMYMRVCLCIALSLSIRFPVMAVALVLLFTWLSCFVSTNIMKIWHFCLHHWDRRSKNYDHIPEHYGM